MANKTFNNVQLFEEFLTVLQNTDGTRRRTLDGAAVDLMANLDPSGRTNLAIELAKISKWYDALFIYTAPTDPTEEDGEIIIREEMLPDSVRRVKEGYYNNGAFYEDALHTELMTPVDNAIYIDDHTDTLYIYDVTDPLDKHYKALDTDTTYTFTEGTTDGSFNVQASDAAQASSIKVHNVEMVNHGYYGDDTHFYSDAEKTQAITLKQDTLYIDTATDKVYFYNGTVLTPISSDETQFRLAPVETQSGSAITDKFKLQTRVGSGSWTDVPTSEGGSVYNIDLGLLTVSSSQSDPDYNVIKIKSSLLPSYVDDVIEGYYDATTNKFYEDAEKQHEIAGETGKIYVDILTNDTYRWVSPVTGFVNITNPLSTEAICQLLSITYTNDPETVGDFIGVDTSAGEYTLLTDSNAPADWGTANKFYTENSGTYSVVSFSGSGTAGDPYVPSYAANTYYVAGTDGKHGLVPAPSAINEDQNHYLKGDGTWSSPIDDINTLILHANNTPTIS